MSSQIAVRQSSWFSNYTYSYQPYETTLTGVLAGSLIYAVTSWPNDTGTTLPFENFIVYDNFTTSSAPYEKLGQVNDTAMEDSQSYAHYYRKSVEGGDYTFSLFDTEEFESGRLQYMGLFVFEIINADAVSPLAGHAELGPYSVSGTTANSISGSLSVSAAPALLIGACGGNAGTAPVAAPNAGTGFTDEGAAWEFIGNGTSRWVRAQSKRITSGGTQAAHWTPTGTDVYIMTLAAFLEAQPPTLGQIAT